ncbi:restriction endonuclease [Yersinia ruckeri]|uniref:McrC family protein n=2 Tax=Yersinia ruckeri TaxID=29486 RepID=UPI0004E44BA2|nr:McrC family protein [Yersinia ruckeri]ARZ02411.1 5-methylcytosine-specific restriction enzyme subunit McrC [Yersinia ruckeri]KFE39718.1 restriction endonuclease [Yersinia ruckeri]OIX31887.1 restriction endonuclease [Yersinia ruckeri]OIX39732.1 restriction endonuclease [Yersinia ruckeri]OIX39957.1 restriction endonuclease [Yersinia ruckeri]
MSEVIYVFEYDLLGSGKAASIGAKPIPQQVFDYLEELSLTSTQGSQFLKLTSRSGFKLLQVQNYAGMLSTPHGFQLEILPKVGKNLTAVNASETLLTMLSHLPGFRHIQTQQATLQAQRMPLLEIFISQFLHSVSQLLKQGLRSNYMSEQGNLSFMKGKLMLSAQLRHNVVSRHKFCVDYDDYMPDCVANRLLHSTLDKLLSLKLSSENQRWLYELRFAFDGIPLSRDIESDISSLRLERGMAHYTEPMAWAQLILRGMSPSALQGNAKAMSLLFPMEAVFESFVAQTLPYELPPHLKVQSQVSTYSLVKHGLNDCFKLRPDLLIQSRQPVQTKMVMDTKWKLVNSSQQTKSLYGLAQSDFYQMFAYGQKYLDGKGEMYLIYPAHDDFNQPIPQHFAFSETLKLWVVPYQITAKPGARMMWAGDVLYEQKLLPASRQDF